MSFEIRFEEVLAFFASEQKENILSMYISMLNKNSMYIRALALLENTHMEWLYNAIKGGGGSFDYGNSLPLASQMSPTLYGAPIQP